MMIMMSKMNPIVVIVADVAIAVTIVLVFSVIPFYFLKKETVEEEKKIS